jgi:hypothetical protein
MVQITLNDEQSKKMEAANGSAVAIVDPSGQLLGYLRRSAFSEADVADAVRRADSGGPWYTTEEVLEHLSKLEK